MIMRIRKWIIRKTAGQMGVCLNCALIDDERRGPGIAYASTHGGMCENLSQISDQEQQYKGGSL